MIASKYDVKKLIYISSIKVFDNSDLKRSTISNNSKENPKDIYGKSKLKAENYLKKASAESSIDYVIIRPPVIYGSGVKGNVHMLSKLIRTNIPLPLKTFKTNKKKYGFNKKYLRSHKGVLHKPSCNK